jgi:hypothetical protein
MKERRETIVDLAREARSSLERLLEALGWPADEAAFHCAIDRLLILEEQDRANR